MASTQRPEHSEDLIDSWVELHYSNQPMNPPDVIEASSSSADPQVSYTGSIEKLLIDAQRESRTPSRPQSKESSVGGSPKSPPSPSGEWPSEEWKSKQDPGTDWIWDWSSRPEALQSFENWNERFRHPGSKGRPALSVRNTNVMKKTRLFSLANLPTLILTHACTFFLGAAAVLLYMKKYCNLPAIAHATLD
ncbi:BCL2/adenovirus E1B 19 kDa protein-interacting protein 3 [Aplysia californica]|uniref:BCL2/adenovirus E1B 19 kDa protein-interacting protein 3 n=1 Tax=Aplysia californica TaxID=6500 RepID=A0ABM0JEE8_APLCA|nr:BCL2/adenovirus E1B 19 kDa protein-interacting protein 3 [Aplysia californica]